MSEPQQDQAPTAGGPVQLSPLLGHAALIPVASGALVSLQSGTVGANVEIADSNYFPRSSDVLIRGEPVMRAAVPAKPALPQPRAKDLIAEINSINSQIHRIMSQVEQAVARLATSG